MRNTLMFLTLSLIALARPAYAYTCFQAGIGNLVVSKGRVYFSQADRSLTALDLMTGKILAHTVPDMPGVRLQDDARGIVCITDQSSLLLDRDTLRVIGSIESDPDAERRAANDQPSVQHENRHSTAYCWGARTVTIQRAPSTPTVITVTMAEGQSVLWRGVLPYLQAAAKVQPVIYHDRLLLASDFGHLECVDLITGQSQWIYTSPTMVIPVSWTSPNGLPPRLTTQARVFKEQNANREHLAGLRLIPVDGTTFDPQALLRSSDGLIHPPIIADPSPLNPFPDISAQVKTAWAGTLVASGILCCSLLLARRWRWARPLSLVAGIACVIGLSQWLGDYCRISDGATCSMKILIVSLLVLLPFHAARCLPARKWLRPIATSVFLLLSAGWAWRIWVPLCFG